MSTQAVLVNVEDKVAVVTLNRPDRMNAVNGALRSELTAALKRVNQDDAVRAVVITGAGPRAFCSGQDL
jgi:enoyl-CoA hydratase/carnithine racemase